MTDWMQSAACRDLDVHVFFPGKGAPVQLATAQRICAACPTQIECAQHQQTVEASDGVWAGQGFGQEVDPSTQRIRICVECAAEFSHARFGSGRRAQRCPSCAKQRRQNTDREAKRRYRAAQKVAS